jgi:CMP/dCMP kinase
MAVVTISRQLGCGGREIGLEVAARLRSAYMDRGILSAAASLVGAPESAVECLDERCLGMIERLTNMIARAFTPSEVWEYSKSGRVVPAQTREVGDVRFLFATRRVIRQLAGKGNVVIVGRGGQILLKDCRHALHIRIRGSLEARTRRLAERDGLSIEAATALIRESDRQSEEYLQRFYREDWDNPSLYHLIINTDRLAKEDAIDLIVAGAQAMDKRELRLAMELIGRHSERVAMRVAYDALSEALAAPVGTSKWLSSLRTAMERLRSESLTAPSAGRADAASRDNSVIGRALTIISRLVTDEAIVIH